MDETPRSREEHLAWCKQRALDYLPQDPAQAVASMASDLRKHPDFRGEVYDGLIAIGMMALMGVLSGGDGVRRWIEGFN